MSALDDLRTADTLQFTDISYSWRLGADGPGTTSTTGPICVRKDGPLEFTLTSEDLLLPVPGLMFRFSGTANDNGTMVTWRVNQSLDVTWAGVVRITGAEGQVISTLAAVPPVVAAGCDGRDRVFAASVTSVPESSSILVRTSIGDARIDNLVATARPGGVLAPVFFNVSIRADAWEQDGCGDYFQIVGNTVRLTCSVEDLRAQGTVTGTAQLWDLPVGGRLVPIDWPLTQPTISLFLDAPGTVHVRVLMRVSTDRSNSGNFYGALEFAVLTPEEAEERRVVCRLRGLTERLRPIPAVMAHGVGAGFMLHGRRFVDPLWDPVPDDLRDRTRVLARGYNAGELRRIRGTAKQIADQATELVTRTTRLLEEREKATATLVEAFATPAKGRTATQSAPRAEKKARR